MARPEKPITWDGPIADLARALRELRGQAGQTYRELATATHCSASVLADAAAGVRCPTWQVTRSFVAAAGGDERLLHPFWLKASEAARRGRSSAAMRRQVQNVLKLSAAPPTPGHGHSGQLRLPPDEPDPWAASTPAQYIHQLRALRAWSGQPGRPRNQRGRPIPPSTLYDALSTKRTVLPRLSTVQAIVEACGADTGQWTGAWRAIRMREFAEAEPAQAVRLHAVPAHEQSLGGDDETGRVEPILRPAAAAQPFR